MSNEPLIVQVSAYYPPHMGGLEEVVHTTSHYLAKRGHPVLVLTSGGVGSDRSHQEHLTVKTLGSVEFAHTPLTPTLPWHLLTLPTRSLMHLHLSQAYYPEMVLLTSRLRSIPYIVHFHLDVGPSGFFGPLFLVYKKILWGPLLRGASRVIVFSDEQSLLVEKKYRVPTSNIAIIPNGVRSQFFTREPKIAFNSPSRILYVGRFSVQKRVDRLIKAVALLNVPVEVALVGDGEEAAALQRLTKELGLKNIVFVGKKYGDALLEYYRSADMFVLPSDIEGMPLVLLEAMAAGLPVIGSNVAGIRELIEEVGIVADPSPVNLASAIEAVARSNSLAQELSKKSVDKARQYSWPTVIDRLEDVYREVV